MEQKLIGIIYRVGGIVYRWAEKRWIYEPISL